MGHTQYGRQIHVHKIAIFDDFLTVYSGNDTIWDRDIDTTERE